MGTHMEVVPRYLHMFQKIRGDVFSSTIYAWEKITCGHNFVANQRFFSEIVWKSIDSAMEWLLFIRFTYWH